MIYSVGIVDIVVDADAVDVTGRIDLPSAVGIIRARRSSPVGTVDTDDAAVDDSTRKDTTHMVGVNRVRRS